MKVTQTAPIVDGIGRFIIVLLTLMVVAFSVLPLGQSPAPLFVPDAGSKSQIPWSYSYSVLLATTLAMSIWLYRRPERKTRKQLQMFLGFAGACLILCPTFRVDGAPFTLAFIAYIGIANAAYKSLGRNQLISIYTSSGPLV